MEMKVILYYQDFFFNSFAKAHTYKEINFMH